MPLTKETSNNSRYTWGSESLNSRQLLSPKVLDDQQGKGSPENSLLSVWGNKGVVGLFMSLNSFFFFNRTNLSSSSPQVFFISQQLEPHCFSKHRVFPHFPMPVSTLGMGLLFCRCSYYRGAVRPLSCPIMVSCLRQPPGTQEG